MGLSDAEFTALYRMHDSYLRRVAGTKLGTKYADDMEDVVQQSWMKIMVHYDTWQRHSSFRTWATRITLNEAGQCLRKHKTQRHERTISIDTVAWADLGHASYEPRMDPNYLGAMQLFQTLSSETQVLLRMHFLEGMTYQEMAGVLNETACALKLRIFHRLKALQLQHSLK